MTHQKCLLRRGGKYHQSVYKEETPDQPSAHAVIEIKRPDRETRTQQETHRERAAGAGSHEAALPCPKHAYTATPGATLAIARRQWRERRVLYLLLERCGRAAGAGMQVVQVWHGRARRLLQVHVAVAGAAAAAGAGVGLHEEQAAGAAQAAGELAETEALNARDGLAFLGCAALEGGGGARGEAEAGAVVGSDGLQGG